MTLRDKRLELARAQRDRVIVKIIGPNESCVNQLDLVVGVEKCRGERLVEDLPVDLTGERAGLLGVTGDQGAGNAEPDVRGGLQLGGFQLGVGDSGRVVDERNPQAGQQPAPPLTSLRGSEPPFLRRLVSREPEAGGTPVVDGPDLGQPQFTVPIGQQAAWQTRVAVSSSGAVRTRTVTVSLPSPAARRPGQSRSSRHG